MKKSLFLGILIYTLTFSGISLWKYSEFRYNGRDLAIYNQVVWQLGSNKSKVESQKIVENFYSSIQGHNYLGDHFEPILLLIAPIYALFPDPRTLLILQTLVLALAAWPLCLISHEGIKALRHRVVPENRKTNKLLDWTPTLVGLLWLLHPAVQNANLYEFHSVAFAPLFLFSLFFFSLKISEAGAHQFLYEDCLSEQSERVPQKKIARAPLRYYLLLLLSLSVREDVALITFMLGLIWLIGSMKIGERRGAEAERRQVSVIATPSTSAFPNDKRKYLLPALTILVSLAWFFAAQSIIAHFSPSQGYQYRIYYAWLRNYDALLPALKGIVVHIATLQNIDMLIGLTLPLLFLCFRKPLWLLITFPPLLAIILSQAGGSSLIWQMHYGLLLLPGIFIAFLYAIIEFTKEKKERENYETPHYRINTLLPDTTTRIIALTITVIASSLAFGPLPTAVKTIMQTQKNAPDTAHTEKGLLQTIPKDASIATTDRFLAHLSSRRELTLLPLALLGVQQYGVAPYPSADLPQYLLIDEQDIRADIIQAQSLAWTRPFAERMRGQFRRLIEEGRYGVDSSAGNAQLLMHTKSPEALPQFSFEKNSLINTRGGLILDRLGSVRLIIDRNGQ